MAKTKISQYSSTAGSNTDIDNINIAEGCSPANVNNAIRGLMAQLKDFQSANPTYYTADSDALAVGAGGTGAITATTARTALSSAKSGANSDITSITGLTTPLPISQGGTGYSDTAQISNVNRTSNVVTITTTSAHGFVTNDTVTVAAVTNTGFNGSFTITGTPTSNTFTYAQTASNVGTTSDTGTAITSSKRYVNLTSNVTGTLPLSKGGLGVTSLTPNAIPIGNGTSPITAITPGTNTNVLTSTVGATVNAVDLVEGTEYTILTLGSTATNWTSIGASAGTVGEVFTKNSTIATGDGTATTNTWTSSAITFPSTLTLISTITPTAVNSINSGTLVNAGSFVVGTQYTITTVGTTSFTAIGASSNTVGVVFTATGVGSGTGTATTTINLTNYKSLYIVFSNVVGNSTSLYVSASNTQTNNNIFKLGTGGTTPGYGVAWIDLGTGAIGGSIGDATTVYVIMNQTGISTASTTVYFRLGGTSVWTAQGSIKIYGVK